MSNPPTPDREFSQSLSPDLTPSSHLPAAEAPQRSSELAALTQQIEHLTQALAASEAGRQAAEATLNRILTHDGAAIASFRAYRHREWEYEYRSVGCEVVFGYTAQEFLDNPNLWRSRVLPDDWQAVILPAIAAIFNEQTSQIDYRFHHKDGRVRWISETVSSQRDAAADAWIVTTVATDITSRIRSLTQLQQTQQALDESEQRYRLAVNAGKVGVWDWNLTTNEIYLDPLLKVCLGYEDREIRNHIDTWGGLVHPDDQAAVKAAVQAHLAGETASFELEHRMLHKDGHIRWLLARGHALRDREGRPYRIIGTDMDITERKQTELALQHQLDKERGITRVIQAIRNSLELPIIFSTIAEEIWQLSQVDRVEIVRYYPEQSLWRNVADYRRSPDMTSALGLEIPDHGNSIAAQLKRLEVVLIENASQVADPINAQLAISFPGTWLLVPLQVSSQVWGALSLVKNQPESSWTEAEVDLLVTIANQLAIAIQQTHLYQQVQALNTTLEQQVELRTAELQDALRREATLKDIREAVRQSLDQSQILQAVVQELTQALGAIGCTVALYDTNGTAVIKSDATFVYPSAQGRHIVRANYPEVFQPLLQGQILQFSWLPIVVNPMYPELTPCTILACPIVSNHEVMGDLWLFRAAEQSFDRSDIDLVEQVANQCAIALRQAQLYQAVQTYAAELEGLGQLKDEFLSTVSHELRAPMANIKMAAQMLELVLTPLNVLDARSTRYLNILRAECDRETNLINDLLDLSRLESGTLELELGEVNLSQWLLQVAHPFEERTHHQRQQLIYNLKPHLPPLLTDALYLERAVTELLHNACKYTPAGEAIIVSTDLVRPPALEADPDRASFWLRLSVSNTGVEIPADKCDRIFDKFYRIPNSDRWKHGGTGLGLALVKKLAACLGGTVRLESSSKTVTFMLDFPIQTEPKFRH